MFGPDEPLPAVPHNVDGIIALKCSLDGPLVACFYVVLRYDALRNIHIGRALCEQYGRRKNHKPLHGGLCNLAREIFGKTSQWSELDYEDGRRTTSEDKEGS